MHYFIIIIIIFLAKYTYTDRQKRNHTHTAQTRVEHIQFKGYVYINRHRDIGVC